MSQRVGNRTTVRRDTEHTSKQHGDLRSIIDEASGTRIPPSWAIVGEAPSKACYSAP